MHTHTTLHTQTTSAIARCLRSKWAELLDIDAAEITAHSDFFSLGGNSMLLLGLHIFVAQQCNKELPISELIENAVFSRMVKLICREI